MKFKHFKYKMLKSSTTLRHDAMQNSSVTPRPPARKPSSFVAGSRASMNSPVNAGTGVKMLPSLRLPDGGPAYHSPAQSPLLFAGFRTRMNSPANAGTARKMDPALRYAAGTEKLQPKSVISETFANSSCAHSKLAKLQAEWAQIHGWLDVLHKKMTAHVLRSQQQKLAGFGPGSLAASLSTTPMTRYQQEELRYKGQLATLQQRIDDLYTRIKSEDVKLAPARKKAEKLQPVHTRNRSNHFPALRVSNLDTENYYNSLMAADESLLCKYKADRKPVSDKDQSPVPQ